MRAYDTQKWLLYALLLPITVLSCAWWLLQLWVYGECRPMESLTTGNRWSPILEHPLFGQAKRLNDAWEWDGKRRKAAQWDIEDPPKTAAIALGRFIPAGLCTLWTFAVLFWILLV